MKIFVLTNGIRQLNNSYNQIEYILFLDKTKDIKRCYLELLKEVKDIDDDILILEDDLLLCKDFENRINEVISKYKNDIINFFWKPYYRRNDTHVSREKEGFCFTQCVYYPRGIINKFYNDLSNERIAYDVNIGQALVKNNISFINYRPSLVQHIGRISLINKSNGMRMSNYFIDDLQ